MTRLTRLCTAFCCASRCTVVSDNRGICLMTDYINIYYKRCQFAPCHPSTMGWEGFPFILAQNNFDRVSPWAWQSRSSPWSFSPNHEAYIIIYYQPAGWISFLTLDTERRRVLYIKMRIVFSSETNQWMNHWLEWQHMPLERKPAIMAWWLHRSNSILKKPLKNHRYQPTTPDTTHNPLLHINRYTNRHYHESSTGARIPSVYTAPGDSLWGTRVRLDNCSHQQPFVFIWFSCDRLCGSFWHAFNQTRSKSDDSRPSKDSNAVGLSTDSRRYDVFFTIT